MANANTNADAGAQFKGNSFMLTSDPDPEVRQRFVSLQLMDTISSNESKQTSEFRPLQNNRNDHSNVGAFDGA